jgi:hypothetical protein
MAIVDDLIGTVLVIFFILITVLLIFSQVQKSNYRELSIWRQHELQENLDVYLDSLLLTTEPTTNLSYSILLGSSAYYRTNKFYSNSGINNLEDSFKDLIHSSDVTNSYYFSVEPRYKEVSLVFFISGSDLLDDEINEVSLNLANYINTTREIFNVINVSAKIYFLDYDNSSKCDSFADFECNYTLYDDFYYNNTYTIKDINNFEHNLTRPTNFYDDIDIWKTDWQTATISYLINQPINLSKLEILLPITNSLPSATKFLFPCPKEYSDILLERDKKIINEYYGVISPIYSLNIDPAKYCDDYAINHINELLSDSPGILYKSKGKIILENHFNKILDNLKLEAGEKKIEGNIVSERRIPMPNGDFAYITFEVYKQ